MTETQAAPFPGKSPHLISLGDGLNFGAPLDRVDGTVVPNPLFFLRSNNPPPEVNDGNWSMLIDGRVKNPLSINLDELRALPSRSQEVWLECAGNSRLRFDPPGEGNQWDDQAISNAVFKGVSLSVLLDGARVEDDATEVVFTGHDKDAEGTPFQRGLPLGVAREPEVLLAYEMNGQPIPWPNGGPARLLVPRWAGIASVKWPARIELVNSQFRGYFNAERYIFVDGNGQTVGTVREMPVKSVITAPNDGAALPLKANQIIGFAWSGNGAIDQVDVSTDGQRTWSPARLVRGSGPLAWTRWEYSWTPDSRGSFSIAVRATDSAGNTQPREVPWNKFGYLMNAIVTRTVTID